MALFLESLIDIYNTMIVITSLTDMIRADLLFLHLVIALFDKIIQ